ncbi:uncharacterized protein [Drosophila virilis]|uniref:Uncharacterized protein n=1 Tax=Drosophila virilis TaxID=7244 RepID=A0A0Q9WV69_DROVI|nr:acidic leucine-rich nuclear phosphoprotein 32 family member B [Drosophila virilis]KRF85569.1 uncharacterized protein Dvir_GJ26797 [Drosophila virilis]
MYSKNKSKVLQTLEECFPPLSHDETIEMIAQMVRQPKSNPIEAGLRLGKIDKQQSILHAESQMKLHAAMEHFDATPEALDSVLPVSDKEMNELAEVASSLHADDDDDDDIDDIEEEDVDDELDGDDDEADAEEKEKEVESLKLFDQKDPTK